MTSIGMMHIRQCPLRGTQRHHTDAAKRVFDQYHLHRTVDLYGSMGHWFACALADGQSDGVLYDTKLEAITHQNHNEDRYAFLQITMANMTVCDAEIFIEVTRRLWKAGMRLIDPDHKKGGREIIKRATVEDQLAILSMRPTNLRMPGE